MHIFSLLSLSLLCFNSVKTISNIGMFYIVCFIVIWFYVLYIDFYGRF